MGQIRALANDFIICLQTCPYYEKMTKRKLYFLLVEIFLPMIVLSLFTNYYFLYWKYAFSEA